MSNANTFVGFYNLPAQLITTTSATALLVPAQGVYAGLPSPSLPAATGLYTSIPPDVPGAMTVDAHPFRVRVAGKVNTGASITFLAGLYQVPASIIAAGTQSTIGNDNALATMAASGAFSGAGNFCLEAEFLWDSVSQKLTGQTTFAQTNGVNIAVNSGTAGTLVATTVVTAASIANLNFIPFFTFGTANAANSVSVSEFVLDRS